MQWGDFSGVAIHGGVASSTRGYTHDIEGTKAAISKLDVRCVFRGHQVIIPVPTSLHFSRHHSAHPQDHLHAAKNLVECFKEPVCLVPVELPQVVLPHQATNQPQSIRHGPLSPNTSLIAFAQIEALKAYASWLSIHACSLEQLRYQVGGCMCCAVHVYCDLK